MLRFLGSGDGKRGGREDETDMSDHFTVMFTLDRTMRQGDPQPGDYGLMMGFGPGLTIETCLLQW